MEIARLSNSSIRIKTKNVTVICDPEKETEADVYLMTSPAGEVPDSKDETVTIEGPGEYEVKGLSIKGEGREEKLHYILLQDGTSILLANSAAIPAIKEEGAYDAVVLKVVDKVDEAMMGTFSGSLVILYGDTSLVALPDTQKSKSVNLKKKEDIQAPVILTS